MPPCPGNCFAPANAPSPSRIHLVHTRGLSRARAWFFVGGITIQEERFLPTKKPLWHNAPANQPPGISDATTEPGGERFSWVMEAYPIVHSHPLPGSPDPDGTKV
jgi:hypothetical protein